MLEQQRAVQLVGLLGERPTLCNSHGSDVFSLPFARRLILEYRTPAAEAPFPEGDGNGFNNDNSFFTSAVVQRSTFRIHS
jgi:hypothetical protein